MIDVEVKPRGDGLVDIYVTDGGNHEPLMNSSQGYERLTVATEVARRLFGGDDRIAAVWELLESYDGYGGPVSDLVDDIRATLDDPALALEPVQLTVMFRNGVPQRQMVR